MLPQYKKRRRPLIVAFEFTRGLDRGDGLMFEELLHNDERQLVCRSILQAGISLGPATRFHAFSSDRLSSRRIELHTQGDRAANWILSYLHYPRLHLCIEQRLKNQITIRVRENLGVSSTYVCRL